MRNSRKSFNNSEKEGSWAEPFQGWAEVVLPTFGDALNCSQKGLKNKDYYNNVSAFYTQ